MSIVARIKEVKGIRGAVYRAAQLKNRMTFAGRGLTNFVKIGLKQNGSRPSISAVVVGRNDDYMSDFRERLYATIAWNIRYLVNEVVFVEWNPPEGSELLSYDLAKTFEQLRAYVVPAEIHEGICENGHIKLLEFHAKNVGIRRATSEWIMATNADAAVGLDTVRRVLSHGPEAKTVWTAKRLDIPWREGHQSTITLFNSLRYRRVIPYTELGTGEFCLASRELWHQARGYDEHLLRHRIGCDVRGVAQMVAHGGATKRAGSVLHLTHPTSCTENVQPHHGEWATIDGVPYCNPNTWGLGEFREVKLAERVWRLEP
jgi:hypothetical protein